MVVNEFLIGDKSDKPVVKGSGVNVIYFTNKCNLACTYCYEDLANRPPQILSQEDIRNAVDAILAREDPNAQTLIVLFGGEPTLEWENACYLMDYAYSKKTNVRFNMTTNGIKFLSQKFTDDVKNNTFYKRRLLSFDVSFDGIGNKNRVFHNGQDSTRTMLRIFKHLNDNGMYYRIRYTIHSLNVHNFYNDMKMIVNTFRPERLITSVDWKGLSTEQQDMLLAGKEALRQDWINRDITIPVCELFCDMCDGCGERKEIKTFFTDEGNVTTLGNHLNLKKFDDFKDKEIL